MSLINDALKQARQAQPQTPPSRPPPLPPVESVPHGRRELAGAGDDYFAARRRRNVSSACRCPNTHRPTASAPAAVTTTKQYRSRAALPVVTNPPPGSNTGRGGSAQTAGTEAARHFVCRHAALAIVNGKTVIVGDRIDEFRVTAISKDSVTLQRETGQRTF